MNKLDRLSEWLSIAVELRAAFGNPKLNLGSQKQLLAAFEAAGTRLENTKEETLSILPDPRARQLLDWRVEAKLASNIRTLLDAEHGGRIHAIFDPLGTVTGRFSSKEPNLQNVDRGQLRSCFIPSTPDRRLIVADYSQIELRVAALIAKEETMIAAFKNHADLHKMTAAAVLRKPIEEVTKADRQMAKAVSFGFLYGQSAKGFVDYARTTYGLTFSPEEAERFRENFFAAYPAIRAWHARCHSKARDSRNNSAHTIAGRLLLAQNDDDWARFNVFTEYVVSGSCADLLKLAMVRIAGVLPDSAHLVATVHDEPVHCILENGYALAMIAGWHPNV